MNKILFTSLLSTLLFTNVNAQMIIAEDNNYPTGMVTESSLLQFEEGRSRGIILPANDVAPQNPANGTFVFDMSDIKIKMYENDQWINLTDRGQYPISYNENDAGEGVIIGAETSRTEGVLILESTNRALVLPRVNDISKDVFENMENQVSSLNTLVNSVRNFAKQKQNPQIKTDLVLITQKAIRSLEATEPDIEKVKISFNSKLKTALVLADPFSLELLILNLLRNGAQEAVSNTAKGSPILKVELSLSNDNKSFILLVENSGKLMTDKDLSRLVSLGESVKPDGLGLGLSIIRGIADLHGADLGFTGRDKGGVIASLRIDQLHV